MEVDYVYCIFTPPINLSPTAEKAREILKEVKEAQETFKKQRETIKLEAEVCMHAHVHTSIGLVNYSGTPINGHPSTADTHSIADKSQLSFHSLQYFSNP